MNVLKMFYPIYYKKICFVIDQLPNPENFAVKPFFQQSNIEFFKQNNSQLTTLYLHQIELKLPSSSTFKPKFKNPK